MILSVPVAVLGCLERSEAELRDFIEVLACKIKGKADSRGNLYSRVCRDIQSYVLYMIYDKMASNVVSPSSATYKVPKFEGGTSFSLGKIKIRSSGVARTVKGSRGEVLRRFRGVKGRTKV